MPSNNLRGSGGVYRCSKDIGMKEKKVLYRDCKKCGELTTIRNKGVLFCLKCIEDIAVEKKSLNEVRKKIKRAIARGNEIEESKDKVCPTCEDRFKSLNDTQIYCDRKCSKISPASKDRRRLRAASKSAQRRAKVYGGDIVLTEDEKSMIDEIYIERDRLGELLGIPHEVHHIIEVCDGGLHHPDNLIVLSRPDHVKLHRALKAAKHGSHIESIEV